MTLKLTSFNRFATACAAAAVIMLASCKKVDHLPSAVNQKSQQHYLIATVDGAPFKAEAVTAGTQNHLMVLLGAQVSGKDTTVVILGFPKTSALKTSIAFNPLSLSVMAYGDSKHRAEVYYTNPLTDAVGTYQITSLDTVGRTVSGSFSGTVINTSGKTHSITNGKFSAQFLAGQAPAIPGLNY